MISEFLTDEEKMMVLVYGMENSKYDFCGLFMDAMEALIPEDDPCNLGELFCVSEGLFSK